MTLIVLDTSYAFACVVPDEQRPDSMAELVEGSLIAPVIWPLEVASAMRNGVRRLRFMHAEAQALCAKIASFGVEIVMLSANDPLRHFELASNYDLTPYDALYVDLALTRRAALATCDARLAAAARKLGLPVLQ